jgi:hypothetical protein
MFKDFKKNINNINLLLIVAILGLIIFFCKNGSLLGREKFASQENYPYLPKYDGYNTGTELHNFKWGSEQAGYKMNSNRFCGDERGMVSDVARTNAEKTRLENMKLWAAGSWGNAGPPRERGSQITNMDKVRNQINMWGMCNSMKRTGNNGTAGSKVKYTGRDTEKWKYVCGTGERDSKHANNCYEGSSEGDYDDTGRYWKNRDWATEPKLADAQIEYDKVCGRTSQNNPTPCNYFKNGGKCDEGTCPSNKEMAAAAAAAKAAAKAAAAASRVAGDVKVSVGPGVGAGISNVLNAWP